MYGEGNRLKKLNLRTPKNFDYTKGSKIKFEKFLPRIEMAVSQAKLYCEDVKRLAEELGTAMGSLIEEMRVQ